MFNPFLVNAPISYPMKTVENLSFSGVFKGGIKWENWSKMDYALP